ncbi:MAG: tRNA (cytidine(34)-2'-O)-methyltransferase [Verrucomicrobia bacterium]|nr:tRNA (cytidine(34)-2'-O)-methyltransferase [Verrucomicrobiota bacterium]
MFVSGNHRPKFRNRNSKIVFSWPDPPLNVVLVEPEIPPNTGNIARLCAATGSTLHLVGPLGFRLTDRALKRAGLDYWKSVTIVRHKDLQEFLPAITGRRFHLLSTSGETCYTEASFAPGDFLIFGSETRGLPGDFLEAYRERVLGVPMITSSVRSLNLATTAGIVLYEALRQAGRPASPPMVDGAS